MLYVLLSLLDLLASVIPVSHGNKSRAFRCLLINLNIRGSGHPPGQSDHGPAQSMVTFKCQADQGEERQNLS